MVWEAPHPVEDGGADADDVRHIFTGGDQRNVIQIPAITETDLK